MNVEVIKYPEYLSPSSYMKTKSQPNTYYLTALARLIPRDAQGRPAAIGSAFDFYIKNRFIKTDFKHKETLLDELRDSVEVGDKTEAEVKSIWNVGFEIYNYYMSIGMLDIVNVHDIEIHGVFKYLNVPIMVKLDASFYDSDSKPSPWDWKVKGFNSQASPTPGYYALYDEGVIKPAHKKWHKDITMEEINLKYAIQTAIYGWKLGRSPDGNWEPFNSLIHEMSKTAKGKKRCALIRGVITEKFQENLYKDLEKTWKSLQDDSFLSQLASQQDNNLIAYMAQKESWFM